MKTRSARKLTKDDYIMIAASYSSRGAASIAEQLKIPKSSVVRYVREMRRSGVAIQKFTKSKVSSELMAAIGELKSNQQLGTNA